MSVASRRSARRGLYAGDYLDRLDVDALVEEVGESVRNPGAGWHVWVAEEEGSVVAFARAGPWPEDGTSSIAEVD